MACIKRIFYTYTFPYKWQRAHTRSRHVSQKWIQLHCSVRRLGRFDVATLLPLLLMLFYPWHRLANPRPFYFSASPTHTTATTRFSARLTYAHKISIRTETEREKELKCCCCWKHPKPYHTESSLLLLTFRCVFGYFRISKHTTQPIGDSCSRRVLLVRISTLFCCRSLRLFVSCRISGRAKFAYVISEIFRQIRNESRSREPFQPTVQRNVDAEE